MDLNSKGLTAWPADLTPECEELNLYANKIKKVDKSVGELKKLVRTCSLPQTAPVSAASD